MKSGRLGFILMRFKDPEKPAGVNARATNPAKAALANEMSARIFSYLHDFRISNHFVEKSSESDALVRELAMIPLECIVWNVATADFGKRLGIRDGTELTFPVIEYWWKGAQAKLQLLNEFHIHSLGIATPEQMRSMNRIASKANVVLRPFFERRGLRLASMKLEFGLADGQLMIGDEISQRTCRFMDLLKTQSHRRDMFSDNAGATIKAYAELCNRVAV